MVRAVLASGTQAASINSEHVLLDDTSHEGAVVDCYIDISNMVASDVLEIRIYSKALSGGALKRVYYARFANAQDDEPNNKSPSVYIPPMTIAKEWKLTLKQTAGTGRNYDWTIYN